MVEKKIFDELNNINTFIHELLDKNEQRESELQENSVEKFDVDCSKELYDISQKLFNLRHCVQLINDVFDLKELYESYERVVPEEDIENDIKKIKNIYNKFILDNVFKNKNDKLNAIISIHAGSGGLEAEDWASMLGRMYLRWAVNKRYDAEILYTYETPDSNVGIKKCEFIVRGENAYGLLKNENGVHRLIRKSPFDKAKKRHTSFASVKVEPEIDDTIDIQINKSDLNIERMRGSGSGGQHKNVTASAVRITHIPTGITAYCQNDRSQHKNKESAMKTLYSRLYVREMEEKAREINDKNSNYDQNAFGSQIRTYCVHPTQYIIDHRCNHKEFSIKNILDGNIDDFIMENLKTNNKKEMLNG